MRLLLLLVGVSALLHALFAWHQPFTNDEGAYLYDARTILRGERSAGDVLTKAPVPIAFFAVGEFLTSHSLYASRMVNIIASLATSIPVFLLLRALGGTKMAHIGVVLWLLGSGTIIFHSMGHTQPIASLFAVFSLCFFIFGIRSQKLQTNYLVLAGISFALAYASRKTSAAVVMSLIFSWIAIRGSYAAIMRAAGQFLLGVVVVGMFWFAGVYVFYGFPGVWHSLGVGYGDILLQVTPTQPWAGSGEHMLAEAARIGFVYGLLLIAICITCMREQVLVSASWVAVLGVLYFFWPTHLVEYLADFIPPIVLAGAAALVSFRFSQLYALCIVGVFVFVNIASLYAVYTDPWTGMFTREAIGESALWLREHVPREDEIFTAAVIIPYVSGHNVPFHLSHPQWYRYNFISEQDKRVFLPTLAEVRDFAETRISWVLRDQLSDYVYPDIDFQAFREVARIPNSTTFRTNPLRMYLRE